ncbi:glycoside hydrolase family 43 protein [Pelagicoccus sp. SDUM812003]|uniref:glycoside hydrolase family 43 protein n=1 Tax=Pelagicoccus sp. SDUM812003 TaxID=3041267 RepID=UPI00280E4E90|nr:glycoside hydrolase family 43 protein [Pelagicoccus sp. SDUM812003]MDQ8201775.1 glycoside hydrolase family 43 protein [Pelagicoccus sp. SDUM812003]
MMTLRLPAIFALFTAISVGALSSAQTPSFTQTASVHDPSVIKVGDRFYVFGSHGASAWSTDLMNWTQVASSVNQGNPRHFDTFQSELSELIQWTNATSLWAADVYQLEDGKYYYYYNVWTNHQGYRSYMGLAVSDEIEGPYEDLGEILRGGTGVSGFDPSVDPNTIDPTLYRDTEDNLWMVYGSYSGGIFTMEMDDQTGFQKPNQGWGTYLLGGGHDQIEGPFIDYNAETEKYYLFLSYGGLGANDGYNMRAFRSDNPDGPFYDPAGNDMSQVTGPFADYGLKLAGNWRFTPVEGEPAQTVTGYRSPGHNSVIKDPATGKWFNIFHSRFEGRGELHEIRVHQMFFNEDGWPVMAPHRFAGETQGSYTAAEISGAYKVLNHGKDITGTMKTSEVVGLQESGSLAGADGSWEMVDDKNIRISMNGTLFKGVVSEMWDNENQRWVNAFTAISQNGESLWGSEVAVAARTGDVPSPELEAVGNRVVDVSESLSLTLTNLAPVGDLELSYEVEQGPEGLTVDSETGQVSWQPIASQAGNVFEVRIQIYDFYEPNLSDEVAFYVYVSDSQGSSPIDDWRTENFGENPAEGVAGNGDDPDQDGRPNLVEYALGTDPMAPDVDTASDVELVGDKLVWTFSRTADPALQFEVRARSSLVGAESEVIWSSMGSANLEGDAQVEVDVPAGSEGQVFLELTVDAFE